jgi:hypothetical protein
MALACPYCDVSLTRSEAEDKRCPSCNKTFDEAIESAITESGSSGTASGQMTGGTCDFCGKENHVKSGYLKVSFAFWTRGVVFSQRWRAWCNLRCHACRSCRVWINIWPWLYVALIISPAAICLVPPLAFAPPEDQNQVRTVLKYSCIASIAPIVVFAMLFCTQFWRYRRLLGSELHNALAANFGVYNIYFKSHLPRGEDSSSPAEFIKESPPP